MKAYLETLREDKESLIESIVYYERQIKSSKELVELTTRNIKWINRLMKKHKKLYAYESNLKEIIAEDLKTRNCYYKNRSKYRKVLQEETEQLQEYKYALEETMEEIKRVAQQINERGCN